MRALSDANGARQATYQYDAYGATTASTGSLTNPFRYAGGYRDAESGLYYLQARYYDPSTQQFLSVDPLLAVTGQAYNYVAGSPTNATDPSGKCIGPLFPLCLILLGGAIEAGGAEIIEATAADNTEIAVTEAETLAPVVETAATGEGGVPRLLYRYGGNTANTLNSSCERCGRAQSGDVVGEHAGQGILFCQRRAYNSRFYLASGSHRRRSWAHPAAPWSRPYSPRIRLAQVGANEADCAAESSSRGRRQIRSRRYSTRLRAFHTEVE